MRAREIKQSGKSKGNGRSPPVAAKNSIIAGLVTRAWHYPGNKANQITVGLHRLRKKSGLVFSQANKANPINLGLSAPAKAAYRP